MTRYVKQPAIKWVGGKLWCYDILEKHFPDNINNIFDPFVGGGGMMPAYTKKGVCNKIYSSDLMKPFIPLWLTLRDNPEILIDGYKERWEKRQREGNKVYYEYRDAFNQAQNPVDFLYLIRSSVNGMVRFNSKGLFNASIHITRKGIFPDTLEKIIFEWSNMVKNVDFALLDYRKAILKSNAGDFVFLDPPYAASRNMYVNGEFSPNDLFSSLQDMNNRGVRWMLTYDGTTGIEKSGVIVPCDLYLASFQIGENQFAYKPTNYKTQTSPKTTQVSYTNTVYMNYLTSNSNDMDLNRPFNQLQLL